MPRLRGTSAGLNQALSEPCLCLPTPHPVESARVLASTRAGLSLGDSLQPLPLPTSQYLRVEPQKMVIVLLRATGGEVPIPGHSLGLVQG